MSTKEKEPVDWMNILEKFATHKGSIKDFCNEYSVNQHQLYYRKKKSQSSKPQFFHAVDLTSNSNMSASHRYPQDIDKEIKIEIVRAEIFIPFNDVQLLSSIIKELESSCLI